MTSFAGVDVSYLWLNYNGRIIMAELKFQVTILARNQVMLRPGESVLLRVLIAPGICYHPPRYSNGACTTCGCELLYLSGSINSLLLSVYSLNVTTVG